MLAKSLLQSRGLHSVKRLLHRSAPLFAVNTQYSHGLIDPDNDPLQLFRQDRSQKHAAGYLNAVAATGCFDSESLDQFYDILCSTDLCKYKHLLYYLSSLYLQVDEADKVTQLLMSTGTATSEMSWFAALMIYAQSNGFELPVLSVSDKKSLEFLERRLKDPAVVILEALETESNIAVVGNAPGPDFDFSADDHKTFCFNDYKKNRRLTGRPQFHVVTPSWEIVQAAGEAHLFITGNHIFHRRSRVWRRFGGGPDYHSISCFPRKLWSELYVRLHAPPSAGLLMIGCLAEMRLPDNISLLVAGFSDAPTLDNHSYDQVPASMRHNWSGETIQRKMALESLESNGASVRCIV